eukprot:767530-Hanusia_phi.AAC.9
MSRARTLLALLALCSLRASGAYWEISGSCYGVFSDSHLPNQAKSAQGTFQILPQEETNSVDGYKFANLTITSTDVNGFLGFLVKTFDMDTGAPLGTFQFPLPAYTVLFDSCPNKYSAVSHFTKNGYWNKENPLKLRKRSRPISVSWGSPGARYQMARHSQGPGDPGVPRGDVPRVSDAQAPLGAALDS